MIKSFVGETISFFVRVDDFRAHKDVAAGDTVITMGGIVARVLEREEDALILELMENQDCCMRILIYAIQQVTKKAARENSEKDTQELSENG